MSDSPPSLGVESAATGEVELPDFIESTFKSLNAKLAKIPSPICPTCPVGRFIEILKEHGYEVTPVHMRGEMREDKRDGDG